MTVNIGTEKNRTQRARQEAGTKGSQGEHQ